MAAFLSATVGCGPMPQPIKADASVPARWQNAPPIATSALGPVPDLRGWWHALGDAQLDALIDRALADNLGVRAAAYRLRAARAA